MVSSYQNLHRFLPGSLLPIDKVISIAIRTADALGYAHKQGVVHRDIKPANIMYHLETDTVKVTDFGYINIISLQIMLDK